MSVKHSLIVPCYNEQEAFPFTAKSLTEALATLIKGGKVGAKSYILFVDDGSKDATLEILRDLASKDKRVKVCSFSRNFGQQAALLCGLQAATGDAIIAMDADLQDPPEVALQMIEKWKEGYEVVHGKRRKREGETVFKKLTAFLYYRFMRKITGMEMPKDVGDFKLYDRKVVDAILSMCEYNTMEEVEHILKVVPEVVSYLRNMSPVWRDLQNGKREYIL